MFHRSPSNYPHPLPRLITPLEHSPPIRFLTSKLGVWKHFYDSSSHLNVSTGGLWKGRGMTAGSSGFVDVKIHMEGFNGESATGYWVRIGWFLLTFRRVYSLLLMTERHLPVPRL